MQAVFSGLDNAIYEKKKLNKFISRFKIFGKATNKVKLPRSQYLCIEYIINAAFQATRSRTI